MGDRPVSGHHQYGFRFRRRRFAGCVAGVDLLFGADISTRRRIHKGVRTTAWFAGSTEQNRHRNHTCYKRNHRRRSNYLLIGCDKNKLAEIVERKSVGQGKRVTVLVDIGGRRTIKKKKQK